MFKLKVVVYRLKTWLLGQLAKLINIPTPTMFVGQQSSIKMCQAIAEMGYKKVLLVTDSVLVELGIHKPALNALTSNGVEVAIYQGVRPDPDLNQVREGLALLQKEGCDAVLAIGGGSPIDAAKVMAAGATNSRSLEKMAGIFKIPKSPLPIFAIPTTSGTGSETTVAAVITDLDTGLKQPYADPKLVPLMAALDADLMLGMPPAITAATGIDALTHAIESYLSLNSTRNTDRLSVAATKLIFKHLREAYSNGNNIAAREAMALASFYAGAAFTQTSVGYVHAIAHSFGAKYHTPHGLANAIALVPVLRFYQSRSHDQLAELARHIGLGDNDDSPEKLSDMFIDAVSDLNRTIEIPETLDALQESDIAQIAKEALDEAHGDYAVPSYMNRADCENLLNTLVS